MLELQTSLIQLLSIQKTLKSFFFTLVKFHKINLHLNENIHKKVFPIIDSITLFQFRKLEPEFLTLHFAYWTYSEYVNKMNILL